MIRVILTYILSAFFLASGAKAQEFVDRRSLLADLQSGQYDRLESALSKLQSEYENGNGGDMVLDHAIRTFGHTDPRTQQHLDGWIKAHPESAFAYTARGMYFWRARGHTLYEDLRKNIIVDDAAQNRAAVVPENYVNTDEYPGLALKDFNKAIELNPEFSIPYGWIIAAHTLTGNRSKIGRAYRKALRAHPGSEAVRWRYFFTLIPHNGGTASAARLEVWIANLFANETNANAPASFLTYRAGEQALWNGKMAKAVEYFRRANTSDGHWWYAFRQSKFENELERFKDAINTAQNGLLKHPQSPELIGVIADSYCEMNEFDKAFEYWDQLMELDPYNPKILTEQGWCYRKKANYIEEKNLVSEIESDRYYRRVNELSSAALTYGGFSSYIRYLHAYSLTHDLDRAAEAQPHTEFLTALNTTRPRHISLHAQALFQQHNCEFLAIDKQLAQSCRKNQNCSQHTIGWNYWRLAENTKNNWCSSLTAARQD